MKIGSLFSGIGGLELGLERAGVGHVVWQVEKEPYCRAVLAKHWPEAVRYDDVRTVGAHNLAAVDVICGGFPCQDVSHAGRRAGILDGTRSGLWYDFARIVDELRPSYVVVENVSALLVRGLDVVLGRLAEIGYDAEWDCVPAAAVGAPHIRDRVIVVAYPCGLRQHARGAEQSLRRDWLDGEDESLAHATGVGCGQGNTNGGRCSERSRARIGAGPGSGDRRWAAEPDVGRMAHGVRSRVDRLRALGNAVVPQVAEVVGRVLLQIHQEQQ